MARNRGTVTPPPPPRRALVAAARRVILSDTKVAAKQAAKRQDWQGDAWAYFDEIGEIKQLNWFLGNAMAKLRLYAAVQPVGSPPDAAPVPILDEAADVPGELADLAAADLARLKSPIGGQSEILRALNMNLEVAGEGYIVGYGATDESPEEWSVRSVSEVEHKSGTYTIKGSEGDTTGRPLNPDLDTIIRVWQRHPRWADQADSPMRGVLGECRALQGLANQIIVEANSHQPGPLFTMPNELSMGPVVPTESEDGAEAPTDPFMEMFMKAVEDAIADPSSYSSMMSGVIRGPAQYLTPDYLRQITIGRPYDATLDARIQQRVLRIARGLNAPVEALEGHAATTFANAEQIDQDLFEDHLESRCVLIVDALTIGYLRPQLLDAGYPADLVNRVCVWYDADALVAKPDVEENANEAWDRNAISDAAYRKAKGFSEDDAPEAMDVLIRTGLRRGIFTAQLTAAMIAALAEEAGADLPSPADVVEPAPGPAAAEAAILLAAAAGSRLALDRIGTNGHGPLAITAARGVRTPPGRRLMELDRDLRSRLLVLADRTLTRALEKAGNRLKAKATPFRDVLRNVEPVRAAATLGPALIAEALPDEDLLAGAFDVMEAQFLAWGSNAQDQALDIVGKVVGGLSVAQRAALGLRQAADLNEAWAWLRDTLVTLANARLFDPSPAAPALGEFSTSISVPPGLIRQAVARAGGAAGIHTLGGEGTYVALRSGGDPAGGIATGEIMRDVLREAGGGIEGYIWEYGPGDRRHPFPEHQALDQTAFTNFDDPRLAGGGWTGLGYWFPGDHAGCQCDVTPVVFGPDGDISSS